MIPTWPWLSLLIWFPVAAGLVLLALGSRAPAFARGLALVTSILAFLLSVAVWIGFRDGTASMQFVERVSWIPLLHANY
ncbi:membrane protein, partial [mine drainage metagenome]